MDIYVRFVSLDQIFGNRYVGSVITLQPLIGSKYFTMDYVKHKLYLDYSSWKMLQL